MRAACCCSLGRGPGQRRPSPWSRLCSGIRFAPGARWCRPSDLRARAASIGATRSRSGEATYGRREATLWLRAPGEAWRALHFGSTPWAGDGRIAVLETDLFARVSSGGRGSDTLMVHVRQPVFLARSRSRRAIRPISASRTSRFRPRRYGAAAGGHATGDARRSHGGARERVVERWRRRETLAGDGNQFDGSFTPVRPAARTDWCCHGERRAAGRRLDRLPLRIVADSAPALEIPVPGADTWRRSPDARAPS